MKIKKYTAATLKEGKAMILQELGEDAIVLSSRTFKKPDSTGELIEIVAAVDDKLVQRKLSPGGSPSYIQASGGQQKSTTDGSRDEFLTVSGQIINEISSLKKIIFDLAEDVKYKYSSTLGPVYGKLFNVLRNAGFSESESLNYVGKLASNSKLKNFDDAVIEARKLVVENVKFLQPFKKTGKRLVAAFTGPTGCGKTTTLVKLAVVCKLVINADIIIVSADTFKAGGSEQLETLATIAQIPFRAVYSSDELVRLLEQEKSRDFVFIDTSGSSQNDTENISKINSILTKISLDIIYLIISSTHNRATFSESIKKFSLLKPNSLILTKTDEGTVFGEIVSTLKEDLLPLAYFTNGQKIPENIEPATKETLGLLILPKSTGEAL